MEISSEQAVQAHSLQSCARLALTAACLGLALFGTGAARGQIAEQVIDLTSEWAGFEGSRPRSLATFGNRAIFFASTGTNGNEPWVTNGSSEQTFALADTCPGLCSAGRVVGKLNGKILFLSPISDSFSDGATALWITDGTRQGTFPLLERAGLSRAEPTRGRTDLAVLDGKLYFPGAKEDGSGSEVWISDGTAAGTAPLSSLAPGVETSSPSDFEAAMGRVFFLASASSGSDRGLWQTDGSAAGTFEVPLPPQTRILNLRLFGTASGLYLQLKDDDFDGRNQLWRLRPDSTFLKLTEAEDLSSVTLFLTHEESLYFAAATPAAETELWRTDGTVAGTERVSDLLDIDPFPSFVTASPQVVVLGPQAIYFRADEFGEPHLFRSDGTPASTRKVQRACAGEPGCGPPRVRGGLIEFAGRIAYVADDGFRDGVEILGPEPDGAPVGLMELCDVGCVPAPDSPSVADGKLYFYGEESLSGISLWQTDGTAPGTQRLALRSDLLPPIFTGSRPIAVEIPDGWITFFEDCDLGVEPFFIHRTSGQARMLADVNHSPYGSVPRMLATNGSRLVFMAHDDSRRGSLWGAKGDGASVVPLLPSATIFERDFVNAAGGMFFLTRELIQDDGWKIWVSDGTPSGTEEIASEAGLGAPSTRPSSFTALSDSPLGEIVVFTEPSGENPSLWRTDGTENGTERFVIFDPLTYSSVGPMGTDGNRLYFFADRGDAVELWTSDSLAGGTRLLAETATPSFGRHRLAGIQELNGEAILLLCIDSQLSLWRSQGTAPTTDVLLPGGGRVSCDSPTEWPGFVEKDGFLFFMARATGGRIGLWRTDGTTAGTEEVFAGEGTNATADLARAGDLLVFTLDDEEHGRELWASDGTGAGTSLLMDILPGARSSTPRELTAAGPSGSSIVYFSANDDGHGRELWRTDGTAAGTRLVHDLSPGPLSSNPRELTLVDQALFFSADDGLTGQELWRLPLSVGAPPCRASQEALCLKGDRFKVEARWQDFAGRTGKGQAVPLTADTGTFWFFNEDNVEAILKVLDGRNNNGHFWTFYGALSNVEYYLTVTDSITGLTRRYFNPSQSFASVGDTRSFGPLGANSIASPEPWEGFASFPVEAVEAVESMTSATGACEPSAARLCLGEGRFAVEASWTDFAGNSGAGTAVELTNDTGYFWFFNATNVEAVLKVLDGRANNGNFWVFYGSLSNVDFDLQVTDTATGRTKTYQNRNRSFASVGDTRAFPGE